MEEVRVNGVRITYGLAGAGMPVLLIGGTSMPPQAWDVTLAPALLDAGFLVVTYASRGVAPSEVSGDRYGVQELAEDCAGLIEHLALGPCAVVGVSLGGFVAEEVARTRPDLVRCAVLISSAGRSTAFARLDAAGQRAVQAVGPVPREWEVAHVLRTILPSATLQDDDEVVRAWSAMLGAAGWDAPGHAGQLEAGWEWLLAEEATGRFVELEQPCLVISFQHDLYFPPSRGRAAAQEMPLGEFVEVLGAAHGGLIEKAAEISGALVGFLTQQRRPGSDPALA